MGKLSESLIGLILSFGFIAVSTGHQTPNEACLQLLTELGDSYAGNWKLTQSDCSLECGTHDETRRGYNIVTKTEFFINEGVSCSPRSGNRVGGACKMGDCVPGLKPNASELGTLPGPGYMGVDLEVVDLECAEMKAENGTLIVGLLEVDHDGFEVFNLVCNVAPEATHAEVLEACKYTKGRLHDDSILAFILLDEDTGRIIEREDYDLEQFQAQDHRTEIELTSTCHVTLDVACSYLYHHQKQIVSKK